MKFNIYSKKYNFKANLRDKFTLVIGDSGKGKSILARMVEQESSGAVQVETDDNYFAFVLTEDGFKQYLRTALKRVLNYLEIKRENKIEKEKTNFTDKEIRKLKSCKYIIEILEKQDRHFVNLDENSKLFLINQYLEYLKRYWGKEENQPFDKNIIIVDDEDYVDSVEFSVLYNMDKNSYFFCINRMKLLNINYSVSEI